MREESGVGVEVGGWSNRILKLKLKLKLFYF